MDSPTLAEFVKGSWKSACYSRYKPSTRRRVDSALNQQLLQHFGETPLESINPFKIHEWFGSYSQVAPGGANRTLDVLKQVFNHAISCGVVSHNPANGLKRNPGKRITRFLSKEEIARLNAALDQHNGRQSGQQQVAIIRLLLLTGCRKGEIIKLRWSEVDSDRLNLRDTKTGARTVLLNKQARSIINQQSSVSGQSAFVFPAASDSSKPRSEELSVWRKVRRIAALEDVRLHDLRHTFASHAVLAKVPLPVVAYLLGHRQVRMTLRYAHVNDHEAESAAERIGKRLSDLIDCRSSSADGHLPDNSASRSSRTK